MGFKRKWKNKSGTVIYYAWRNMKRRCNDKNDASYHRYGGRGISVCDEWMDSYDTFYEDMHATHADGLTLDRINCNGNYEKSNCRWATYSEQANNKNCNARIEYKGITKTIGEWADELNLSAKELSRAYKRYSCYSATTYNELFSPEYLFKLRIDNRHNQCIECGTEQTCHWYKKGKLCNTCYCKKYRSR